MSQGLNSISLCSYSGLDSGLDSGRFGGVCPTASRDVSSRIPSWISSRISLSGSPVHRVKTGGDDPKFAASRTRKVSGGQAPDRVRTRSGHQIVSGRTRESSFLAQKQGLSVRGFSLSEFVSVVYVVVYEIILLWQGRGCIRTRTRPLIWVYVLDCSAVSADGLGR